MFIRCSLHLVAVASLSFCLLPLAAVAKVTKARAYIFKAVQNPNADSLQTIGVIDFERAGTGIALNGSIRGLTTGRHGFHVHQFGELSALCADAGGHFNPHGEVHGAPEDEHRHVGDLGNVQVENNGNVRVNIQDRQLAFEGPNSIIGRGLVVHEKEDDLGQGGNAESKKTGNAGKRVGCGVIGVKADGSQ